MRNSEVVRILNNIAILLETDDVQFKPRAYEKAARSIEALEEDVEDIYAGRQNALTEISGVGESIAEKTEELIKNGRLEYYEKLKRKGRRRLIRRTSFVFFRDDFDDN
jgi:DNA polymerase (family X)